MTSVGVSTVMRPALSNGTPVSTTGTIGTTCAPSGRVMAVAMMVMVATPHMVIAPQARADATAHAIAEVAERMRISRRREVVRKFDGLGENTEYTAAIGPSFHSDPRRAPFRAALSVH